MNKDITGSNGIDLEINISGQQKTLYRALNERSPELAVMYMGAVLIYQSERNPDKYALAAHGIREMLEKLPKYANVSMQAHSESLGSKVQNLATKWNKTVNNTVCYKDNHWSGDIDGHVERMLSEFVGFFEWMNEHKPRRVEEAGDLLRNLDCSGRMLPKPLEKRNIDTWQDIRNFFIGVAHHRSSYSADDFAAWIDTLERFLLDMFVPRTFADLDTIDAIIMEGESRA
jgi:hypothetical protein